MFRNAFATRFERLARIARVTACIVASICVASVVAAAPTEQQRGGAIQQPPPIRGTDYRLVKNWDFGVTVRDLNELRSEFHTRYVYSKGQLDHFNDEWQRYRDNDNHRFDESALALVARMPRTLRAGEIESGMLRSKWSGTYGYFECRMKVPAGRGFWPAFWLIPESGKTPPEIDVVEIVNNGRDTTRNSFHLLHGNQGPTMKYTLLDKWGSYRPGVDFAEGFHVFAIEWDPAAVRHYVDGRLVADRAFEWKHKDGSDPGPAQVLVNLAVGGKWPGPPLSTDDFPSALQIDYIRIWQK